MPVCVDREEGERVVSSPSVTLPYSLTLFAVCLINAVVKYVTLHLDTRHSPRLAHTHTHTYTNIHAHAKRKTQTRARQVTRHRSFVLNGRLSLVPRLYTSANHPNCFGSATGTPGLHIPASVLTLRSSDLWSVTLKSPSTRSVSALYLINSSHTPPY